MLCLQMCTVCLKGTFARLEITQSKPKPNHEDKSKVTQSLLGWEEVGEEEQMLEKKKVVWSKVFQRMVQDH